MVSVRTRSNNAGGTLGGLSTGEDIIVRIAVKPTSSVAQVQQTVTTDLEPTEIIVEGRHDPSVAPRAVPVAEAMLANLLADLVLRNRAAGSTSAISRWASSRRSRSIAGWSR